MIAKLTIIFACALLVAACAGANKGYMDEAYTSRGAKPVEMKADVADPDSPTYFVYDLPTESKIMVSPTYAAAMAMGMSGAAIRDPESAIPPEPFYEKIALRYLTESGRPNCKVVRGVKPSRAQYEFTYECAAAHVRPVIRR